MTAARAGRYTEEDRIALAEQHIRAMAAIGQLEITKSAHVAATYGVPHIAPRLKDLKASLRNELSFGGDK